MIKFKGQADQAGRMKGRLFVFFCKGGIGRNLNDETKR